MEPVLSAMSSSRMGYLLSVARDRVIYAAPGIQLETAEALAALSTKLRQSAFTVSLDFDERTLRMGYGDLQAVTTLRNAGITVTHSPGLRCGVLIVDNAGWVFSPTALYLESEPQSDETPNAVSLSAAQVEELAVRLSPEAHKEAIANASTPSEAARLTEMPTELGVNALSEDHYKSVETAITQVPPVRFDIVKQVRVFEPYLQYVELTLTGAAVQRHRVRIPKNLQSIGISKEIEGKLKTTFDLIERGSSLSSKSLEDALNDIRKNFTRSLGKNQGRVILKSARPHLDTRLNALRAMLEAHQHRLKDELQRHLDKSHQQVVDYYVPLVERNPPDAVRGGLLGTQFNKNALRAWVVAELKPVFPTAHELIKGMTLEAVYKDVTFETLNQPDFLGSVKVAFPSVDWDKAYSEFRAAGQVTSSEADRGR